jgi:hypothetical protein
MQSEKITPWYKQFWPWFLIAVPTSSIIVGTIVFNLANNTTDSLVVDDYYKEGKAINARIDKDERAKYLNITTEMTITDDNTVSVKFHSGIPKSGEALRLNLYHVTLEEKDQQVFLAKDASGVYRGTFEQSVRGKWRITLQPINEEWKIQRTLNLPQTKPFAFNPK